MKLGEYPYGKAPLLLLILALLSGGIFMFRQQSRTVHRPDLVFTIFAPNHEPAYREALVDFEREHGVHVQLQVVDMRALQSRLQSALQTGSRVPDLVELGGDTMGFFTRGPLKDVGFVDLTDRLHAEGLYDRIVESRYSLWSSRGRIFALPHDVHPVALCYRRDLIEQLGIDVTAIETWDDFVAMGRRITQDLDGDGYPDRYALDLSSQGGSSLLILLLQAGGALVDAEGQVAFDRPGVADTIVWHVRQSEGKNRIGYDAGWGQGMVKAMMDGLVLFYFFPDWRTRQLEMDIPQMQGKVGLMPLPTWERGGRRTSTWGGTGLAITKACERQDLAWELAKTLYFKSEDLADRFRSTNIIPPFKDSWNLDAFAEPRPFWGGQAIGSLYAQLAPEAPSSFSSPYQGLALGMLNEVYLNAVQRFNTSGDEGLAAYVQDQLRIKADYVRRVAARNVFLNPPARAANNGEEG